MFSGWRNSHDDSRLQEVLYHHLHCYSARCLFPASQLFVEGRPTVEQPRQRLPLGSYLHPVSWDALSCSPPAATTLPDSSKLLYNIHIVFCINVAELATCRRIINYTLAVYLSPLFCMIRVLWIEIALGPIYSLLPSVTLGGVSRHCGPRFRFNKVEWNRTLFRVSFCDVKCYFVLTAMHASR